MFKHLSKGIWILAIFLQVFVLVGHDYHTIPNQGEIPILTPSLSGRETLKMRLGNGLEAYLISDPGATEAGAALSVAAGSWDDPKAYPGLAHFLEHMLFLGTEKYPVESDYDRFIHANDGEMNAYTTTDYTLYLFSISSPAFEEALDRFSYFFKKPLFNPSGIERELHSVDQEFEKNIEQNSSREIQVRKELAPPGHPFHQFSTGNIQTLSTVTQDILKQWYEEQYSADRMRLIVYAPYPMNILKQQVLADFKDIPSNGKQPVVYEEDMLSKDMQGKMVYIEPVRNSRTLRLTWELPASLISGQSFNPADFISKIIQDEGPGSLSSILQAEGLAYEVTDNNDRLAKDHLLFSLTLNLTRKGLDNLSQVIERCFQFIHTLQQQHFPPYLFDEFKKIRDYRYQFQSRENVFQSLMELGGRLVYEDLNTFPERELIPEAFDEQLMHEFLNYLRPQEAHFTLITRDSSITFDHKEHWMEVPYTIKSIPLSELETWDQAKPLENYRLPDANPFIPQELNLVHTPAITQKSQSIIPPTHLLIDDAHAKIYFAADDRFYVPQTQWFFEIKTPFIDMNDPQKVVLADLYVKSLEHSLNEYNYMAQMADLSYHLSRTNHGILLAMYGYSENVHILYQIILDRLKHFSPSQEQFEDAKDSLIGKYSPTGSTNPMQLGFKTYENMLYHSNSNIQERAQALEQTSYQTFLNFRQHVYDSTFTEGLLYGNITQEEARHAAQELQAVLNSSPYSFAHAPKESVLVLPPQGPYAVELTTSSASHAIVLAIEEPEFSFKMRAAQQILSQAMSSAFYSTLRTKQQTGYLVQSRTDDIHEHLFTLFAVQSATHDPRDLLARFELFIESFLENMEHEELTEADFNQIRQSLLNDLESSPRNLWDMGNLIKSLAFTHEGDFEWLNERIQGFKDLNYQEFMTLSKDFLGKRNKRRLAILIKGKTDKDFKYQVVSNPLEIRKMSEYTRS